MIDLDCLCLQESLLHNHSKSRSLWLAFCEDITATRNIGITHFWRVEPIDSVDCSGCAFRCEVSALLLRNSNPGIPTYFIQMTLWRLSVFCVYTSQNERLGASCPIRRLWFLLSLSYHSSTAEVVWCLLVEEYIQLLDVAACIIIWLHRIQWGECACVCENNVLRQMHCAGDYRKKI